MELLTAWREICPAGGLVFPTGAGGVESHGNITNRCWYRLQRAIGLADPMEEGPPKPRYDFHSLRHVRASLEIERGANAMEIKKLMGHSTIAVTMDIYGHLFPDSDPHRAGRVAAIADELIG